MIMLVFDLLYCVCMLVFFLIKKYNNYIGGIQDGLYNIKRSKQKMGCYHSADGLLLFWRTNPRRCQDGRRLADTKGRAEANRRQNQARKGNKNMSKVLIIDDDKELCALMKKCVEQENLSSAVAYGGLEGLRLLEENKDDCSLIILDVMMPDLNGFQVLQKIREKSNVPVLMLTAKSDEEDKVSGLRLGADDYLTKPFGINELMARVNSLIRRYTTLNPVTGNEAATMLLKDMVIDKVNRTVTVQNIPAELTGKEFDLLLVLASNKGRVFTKKQLYTQVWTEEYDFDDNNIMAFISKLRKKIEPNPEQPFYIQTVRGVGYRFNKEA